MYAVGNLCLSQGITSLVIREWFVVAQLLHVII